ncbi:MAG: aspartate kinase [Candidatus Eremiobacteraeota bacterium]|nr:aspartate kinase [Candidatus Eremiobacteraeota bacterium]
MSAAAPRAKTLVVQKFGGSSLATPQARLMAAKRVQEALARGQGVVVVASAIGRHPDPYATDTLLGLAANSRAGANVDLLLCAGEIIGASVLADQLTQLGISAQAMTGGQAGILTDAEHGEANILEVDPAAVLDLLKRGTTPVVAGFQGRARDGRMTTIGRGGSDLTAVALADALDAGELDIFTDVDGILTADPHRVPGARTIAELNFEELTELAVHGARVMYDRAAKHAGDALQRLSIKGLNSGVGTTVTAARRGDVSWPVTAVTAASGFTFLHAAPTAAPMDGDLACHIFGALAEAGISLDCININAAGVFFSLRESVANEGRAALHSLPLSLSEQSDCAKIALVGAGMRGVPGVMYRVVRTLVDASVPIIHSTDSHITISVLVPSSLAMTAERALHDHFALGADVAQ